MKKYISALFILSLSLTQLLAQVPEFTLQDSLRGSITPEREWWDLTSYHLQIKVDIDNKSFDGQNAIHYKVLQAGDRMQIDLQPPLKITKVVQDNGELTFERVGNAYYIKFEKQQKAGDENSIEVYYERQPQVAVRPPWGGGVT